ncbi:hypothetical protein M0P65_01345 [Candidatus Gracilibacteria bacterium]|nr:hypothetical protein [Candidatus Gracilibacteria bacterium]
MFSWEFNSKKEKSSSWYTVAIIIAISLIIWGYIVGLYVMSIVIFMFIGVYILIENNTPDLIDIEINESGIKVGDTFYDYPKIEKFSIIYNKNTPVYLRLRLRVRGFKLLDLPITSDVNAAGVRAFLSDYVEEDEKGEIGAIDRILNYLKL